MFTSHGRIDLVVEFADKVFIIEFKCNQSPDVALKQIHTKGYATPFQQSGKAIILGINFSTQDRNISGMDLLKTCKVGGQQDSILPEVSWLLFRSSLLPLKPL